MKNLLLVGLTCLLLLTGSGVVQAMSVTIDGLFLGGNESKVRAGERFFGISSLDVGFDPTFSSKNILLNAELEVYTDIIAEARILKGWITAWDLLGGEDLEANGGESGAVQQWLVGARRRVMTKDELSLFLGGGYSTTMLETKLPSLTSNYTGTGFYGKAGINIQLTDRVSISGDFAYVPIANFTVRVREVGDEAGPEETNSGNGTLSHGRGVVVYDINDYLGLQLGFAKTAFSISLEVEDWGSIEHFGTLFGAGLVVYF